MTEKVDGLTSTSWEILTIRGCFIGQSTRQTATDTEIVRQKTRLIRTQSETAGIISVGDVVILSAIDNVVVDAKTLLKKYDGFVVDTVKYNSGTLPLPHIYIEGAAV